MQEEEERFYPIKLISRTVLRKRAFRLRAIWFGAGAAFGVTCAVALVPQGSAPVIAEAAPEEVVVATLPPVQVQAPTLAEPKEELKATAPVELKPAEPKVEAKNAKPEVHYPLTLDLRVSNGDTLITLLTDAGVPYDEAHKVVQALGKNFNPKRLDIGQNVSVVLDKPVEAEHAVIARMMLPVSLTSTLEVTREASDFMVKKVEAAVERKLARAGGRITSSLYETGMEAGIPVGLLQEIITAYSYDVDFQRDIKEGDAIDVLYERMDTKEGHMASFGNVMFAQLDMGGTPMKIYRYVDKNGFADYYNEKGESVRKALLRTPVNGARITSRFGMRNHPLLGYSKMHRGVDFGAPTGTPIYAAGDGVVTVLGEKGGYGKYLRIRHNGQYSTAYAHMSRYASSVKVGSKVKQGQIVAYVGSTGQSTGPHLHYEMLVNSKQVNPSSVKFKTGTALKGTELANFRKNIDQIEAWLSTTPRGTATLAMADKPIN